MHPAVRVHPLIRVPKDQLCRIDCIDSCIAAEDAAAEAEAEAAAEAEAEAAVATLTYVQL